MTKIKLSPFQMFAITVLYCLGASTILFVARDAKQDAWIAILIGGMGAVFIFRFIYGTFFYLNQEDPTFYDTIERLLGKKLGKALILIYAAYFIFITFFILRDIVEIIELYILNRTPRPAIALVQIIVILYGLQRGIETIFRTAELYLFVVTLCYVLMVVLLSFSGVLNFSYLQPVLEHGFGPILKTAPVLFLSIPFGELVVFLALFPLLKDHKKGIRAGTIGLYTVILITLLITIFLIAVLGPYLARNITFPVVVLIRFINVGEFIQRLDALLILIFLTGSIFQILVLSKVAVQHIKVVTNIDNQLLLSLLVVIAIYFGAFVIGNSRLEYLNLGTKIFPFYIASILELGIPLILLILSYYHRRKRRKDPLKEEGTTDS